MDFSVWFSLKNKQKRFMSPANLNHRVEIFIWGYNGQICVLIYIWVNGRRIEKGTAGGKLIATQVCRVAEQSLRENIYNSHSW